MFAGSDQVAEAMTVPYSLIGSCRLAEFDPQELLKRALKFIVSEKDVALADLTPMAIKNKGWPGGNTG